MDCRGAVVKAMAICTRHPFLHIYKVSQHARQGGKGIERVKLTALAFATVGTG